MGLFQQVLRNGARRREVVRHPSDGSPAGAMPAGHIFRPTAMTMNFKIKDHALIQGIKIDDAVTFAFIQSDGDYVITHLKPASK